MNGHSVHTIFESACVRFQEEFGAYLALKSLFGEEIKNYMIVVFVGADAYGSTFGT